MGYLKGKSSLMIFDRHANLKYKYEKRHFWARGYFADTAGPNKKAIKAYIQNAARGPNSRPGKHQEICGPVYGQQEYQGITKTP